MTNDDYTECPNPKCHGGYVPGEGAPDNYERPCPLCLSEGHIPSHVAEFIVDMQVDVARRWRRITSLEREIAALERKCAPPVTTPRRRAPVA